MIKVENINTWGFEHAVRAMRHPHESYAKSDSRTCLGKEFTDCTTTATTCPRKDESFDDDIFCIGDADLGLMQKLYKAGVEHRTYARMIEVWMDVTAPLYWWKEADRYTVGKTQISTSTMHSIHKKPFELDDFSHEHLCTDRLSAYCPQEMLEQTIKALNFWRYRYLTTNNKSDWWQMIQLLPSSYNQKRTIIMSYEVVFKIIHERSGHKLKEWGDFVEILKDLPYVREIMGEKPTEDEQLPGQITIDEYMEGKG